MECVATLSYSLDLTHINFKLTNPLRDQKFEYEESVKQLYENFLIKKFRYINLL